MKTKLKIAHICPFYTPAIGGVKQVAEELAERQIKQGHEVHIYTSDSDKEKRIPKKEETLNSVRIHRCPYWFKVSRFAYVWPSVFSKLQKEHSKSKFNIIHTHVFGHSHTFLAALFAKLKKIPHIHTTHCPWTDAFRPWTVKIPLFFTNLFLNKLSFKFCTKVIAITPWEIPILKKWIPESKIINIPNGMDKIFFKKIKNNPFKKKYNINKRMILFFGRLNITKGPEHFAQVAKEIVNERDDLAFVIVGPDEGMKEKIEKIIKELFTLL